MNEREDLRPPAAVPAIEAATGDYGFTMASDRPTGSLLRTLAASKPSGRFLELGTGTGLSAAWLLDGMDAAATLITVDEDSEVVAIARRFLAHDRRLTLHLGDGAALIDSLQGQAFDFTFADTWPGKFHHLEQTLALVGRGGFYVIDDLLPQPNWPDDHPPKVAKLIATLEARSDFNLTWLGWSTGLIVAVKKP